MLITFKMASLRLRRRSSINLKRQTSISTIWNPSRHELFESLFALANCQAAVEAWKAGTYDLIVMDCQMPRMDGHEATLDIRRFEVGMRRTPIVTLTADVMADVQDR